MRVTQVLELSPSSLAISSLNVFSYLLVNERVECAGVRSEPAADEYHRAEKSNVDTGTSEFGQSLFSHPVSPLILSQPSIPRGPCCIDFVLERVQCASPHL